MSPPFHFEKPVRPGLTDRPSRELRYLMVIRMERVPYIDQSGLYTLEDAVTGLMDRHKAVALTGLQSQVEDML